MAREARTEVVVVSHPPGRRRAALEVKRFLKRYGFAVSISTIDEASAREGEAAAWIALWSRECPQATPVLRAFAERGRLLLVLLEALRPEELPHELRAAPRVHLPRSGGEGEDDAWSRALAWVIERAPAEPGSAEAGRAGQTVEGEAAARPDDQMSDSTDDQMPASTDDQMSVSTDEQMAASSPTLADLVFRELGRLPLGRMVFNPPERMRLGSRQRLEARISRDLDVDLLEGLKGLGIPQLHRLRVGPVMTARLSGRAFEIDDLSEAEQAVGKRGWTEWAWDVVPRQVGRHTLRLRATVRLLLPGLPVVSRDEPVLEREIEVRVNVGFALRRFTRSHWRWLTAAVVVPVLIALARIYLGG